jgi:hypothetical protein
MAKVPLICVDDYEKYAKEKLGQYAGLIVNRADDSITANDNKLAPNLSDNLANIQFIACC